MQISNKDIGIEVFYSPWPGNNDRLWSYSSLVNYISAGSTKAINKK
jgi:hypothetical protein